MPTIDKKFADKIVAANGVLYPDDPFELKIVKIVEYTDFGGKRVYGFIMEKQDLKKYDTPTQYIRDPKLYWEAQ